MNRVILHIDFDSYFASVEQEFDPKLRGRPIGVTATNGRTCIIAASREAKKLGIKSPTRVWEARKICPELITVPAHFEKYWEITQRFLDICKDYSPYVELFSLDEVFIDITLTENLFGGRNAIVKKIKTRIAKEIGEFITVSVGLSHNKLLAKLGSGMNKPDGFSEITRENVEDVYSRVKLADFCGIGQRVEARLNKIGIYTPLQLRSAPLETLTREFKDAEGHFLKEVGMARDDTEIIPYYLPTETKSVSRNCCIPQNEYDQIKILQHVFELCEEVSLKLRRLGLKARTVGLYLGGERSNHGRKTLQTYIDSGQEIFNLCKALYDEWGLAMLSREEGMVRQISIWTGSLEKSKNLSLPLFDSVRKEGRLQIAVDNINDKFGDHTIRSGFLLYGPNLKTVPNGYMADRFERQKVVQKFQERLQTN